MRPTRAGSKGATDMNRYHRQMLLPQIGPVGQAKLAAARVLLVGCGALGSHIAEQLVRAGVGFLRLVDRDIVELTNLQRQVLFDEKHAIAGWPKAAAAAERLGEINSQVRVEPRVIDLHAGNIESEILSDVILRYSDGSAQSELPHRSFGVPQDDSRSGSNSSFDHSSLIRHSDFVIRHSPQIDLILDGTDNVATRYLLNDVAVKHGISWVYGACVGVEGRVMAIRPGHTPCLRCIFPTAPKPEELATCDTAGVLGPAAAIVASLQVVAALKLLTGNESALPDELLTIDLWSNRFHGLSLKDARRSDCPCCGLGQFEFLSRPPDESAVTLCGRDAVQIRGEGSIQLSTLADRWRVIGTVEQTRFFVRCQLTDPADLRLTLFEDGRLIVQGTRDAARAKSLYARYVGS